MTDKWVCPKCGKVISAGIHYKERHRLQECEKLPVAKKGQYAPLSGYRRIRE